MNPSVFPSFKLKFVFLSSDFLSVPFFAASAGQKPTCFSHLVVAWISFKSNMFQPWLKVNNRIIQPWRVLGSWILVNNRLHPPALNGDSWLMLSRRSAAPTIFGAADPAGGSGGSGAGSGEGAEGGGSRCGRRRESSGWEWQIGRWTWFAPSSSSFLLCGLMMVFIWECHGMDLFHDIVKGCWLVMNGWLLVK